MNRFPCYDFSAARHRDETPRFVPPLHERRRTPIAGVGYLPLYADGRLFLSYKRGMIAAHDARTLGTIWERDLGTPYEPLASKAGALVLAGDTLVATASDALVLIDPGTGKVRDRQPMTDFDLWGAAIVGDVLVAQHWDGELQLGAYDLRTREFRWQRPIGEDNSLLAADARVVCRVETGAFAAADVATGKDRWSFPVEKLGRHVDEQQATVQGSAMGRPIIFDGAMIGSVSGHHVVAIELESGEARWTTRLAPANTANLSCSADGEITVLGYQSLHTLDARSGAIIREIDLTHALHEAGVTGPFSRPGISETHLFCGDWSGGLIAIERARGTIDWKVKLGGRIPSGYAPLILDGRCYAVDARGNFHAYEAVPG